MKRIEQTPVYVEMLVVSDAFEARLQKPHVSRLADSIKAHGLIHPPVVRASDMQVIAGEDRVAAHVLLGCDEVLVDMVECSDEEVAALREEENIRRRSPAEVKAMVDSFVMANGSSIEFAGQDEEYQASGNDEAMDAGFDIEPGHLDGHGEITEVSVEVDTQPTHDNMTALEAAWGSDPGARDPFAITAKRPRGRPKTQKSKAIEETAKKLGVTPNAVRKKIARVEPEGDAPPWNDWGREKPEIQAKAATAYRLINRARSQVLAAMKSVTLAGKALAMSEVETTEAWEALKKTADKLAGYRPTMLCAWCKGQPKVMKTCAACNGTGYLSECVSVTRDLQDPGVVYVFGRKTIDDDLGI